MESRCAFVVTDCGWPRYQADRGEGDRGQRIGDEKSKIDGENTVKTSWAMQRWSIQLPGGILRRNTEGRETHLRNTRWVTCRCSAALTCTTPARWEGWQNG